MTGRLVQFHWHEYCGHTALQIKNEIHKFLGSTKPHDVRGRIKFMSMFNDIECGQETMSKHVLQMPQRLRNTRSNSSLVNGVSEDQDKKK